MRWFLNRTRCWTWSNPVAVKYKRLYLYSISIFWWGQVFSAILFGSTEICWTSEMDPELKKEESPWFWLQTRIVVHNVWYLKRPYVVLPIFPFHVNFYGRQTVNKYFLPLHGYQSWRRCEAGILTGGPEREKGGEGNVFSISNQTDPDQCSAKTTYPKN